MATITVKNIPDALYDQLKQTAGAHRRSVNQEVIVCIERAIGEHANRLDVDEEIRRARRLRQYTANCPITDAEFMAAKRAGRP